MIQKLGIVQWDGTEWGLLGFVDRADGSWEGVEDGSMTTALREPYLH